MIIIFLYLIYVTISGIALFVSLYFSRNIRLLTVIFGCGVWIPLCVLVI